MKDRKNQVLGLRECRDWSRWIHLSSGAQTEPKKMQCVGGGKRGRKLTQIFMYISLSGYILFLFSDEKSGECLDYMANRH